MTLIDDRPAGRTRSKKPARLYTTQEVLDATGISFRVLDYWLRTGVIVIGDRNNTPGSGNARRYTACEVKAIKQLVARYRVANAELEAIRSGQAWRDVFASSLKQVV